MFVYLYFRLYQLRVRHTTSCLTHNATQDFLAWVWKTSSTALAADRLLVNQKFLIVDARQVWWGYLYKRRFLSTILSRVLRFLARFKGSCLVVAADSQSLNALVCIHTALIRACRTTSLRCSNKGAGVVSNLLNSLLVFKRLSHQRGVIGNLKLWGKPRWSCTWVGGSAVLAYVSLGWNHILDVRDLILGIW